MGTELEEQAQGEVVAAYRRAIISGLKPSSVVVLVLDMSDPVAHVFAEGLHPERFARHEAHGAVMVTYARRESLRDELGRVVPETAEFFERVPPDGYYWICSVSDGFELTARKIPGPVFAGDA